MLIRVIPCFLDATFDLANTKYLEGDHFNFFFNLKKLNQAQKEKGLKPIEEKALHWSLSYYEKTLNNYESKQLTEILSIDMDLIDKKDLRQADVTEVNEVINSVMKTMKIETRPSYTVTGGGFHIYFFFDELFDIYKHPWIKELLLKVKSNLPKSRFAVDTMSFNPNRTMRLPLSLYMKKDSQIVVPLQLTYGDQKKESFKKLHENFKTLAASKKINTIDQENALKTLHLRHDIEWQTVIGTDQAPWSGCKFLRWSYEAQNEVNYEEWVAQLTLLSRLFKDPDTAYEFAIQFSNKHPKFDEEQFAEKFDETLENMYPATCKHISSIWKHAENQQFGCASCPHRAKNMPLLIQSYPNKDTGFREVVKTKNGMIRRGVNYDSLVRYLFDQEGLILDREGTYFVYNEKEKQYKSIGDNEVIANYKKLVDPALKPEEMTKLKTALKYHKIEDIDKHREKNRDNIFFKDYCFNIKTKKQEPLRRDHFNFYNMAFNYDPNAICPNYEQVLDFAFAENVVQRDYFLKFMACAIFDDQNVEKAMVLIGDGANGKSTLVNGIIDMFPDKSEVITPLSIDELKKDSSMLYTLRRAKIAYESDVSGRKFSYGSDFLKKLISQEAMTFRRKYATDSIAFRNPSKIVLGMNDFPKIYDSTGGFERRFTFLEFDNVIPADNQDYDIRNKIKKESAGIFNLLLVKYIEFCKDKKLPKVKSNFFKEALEETSSFHAFCAHKIKVTGNPDHKITNGALYKEFQDYCIDLGENTKYIMNKISFGKQFTRRFKKQIRTYRTNLERGKTGLKIVDDMDNESELGVVGDNTNEATTRGV